MQTHDRGDRVFPLDGLVPAFRRNINTFQDDGIGLAENSNATLGHRFLGIGLSGRIRIIPEMYCIGNIHLFPVLHISEPGAVSCGGQSENDVLETFIVNGRMKHDAADGAFIHVFAEKFSTVCRNNSGQPGCLRKVYRQEEFTREWIGCFSDVHRA